MPLEDAAISARGCVCRGHAATRNNIKTRQGLQQGCSLILESSELENLDVGNFVFLELFI